ncbi:DNA internalization-related competence protein ComEC/Rec2 [Curvibacter sp. CHRR-16]|uniref:DNA internalization-related competence protein ComEC/Rec2 n=1 Tax=Curvibacter sp. CHRR-16 TaxID=2835872 RepID=UPI001BDA9D60|nr:DNA internalization-related competence protein ComEC/Rec2 [Curvibacter sp. CHRR-16]MBT0570751.1 DNA internalization-related competence protein ComEC/Rec2 [Curvibacter sp. CHRR-16]
MRRTLPPLRISTAALAWLLGVALQLQQAQLYAAGFYAGSCAAALLLLWLCARWQAHTPCRRLALPLGMLLAAAVLGWGSTGWRAAVFDAQRLAPALEGQDIAVVGVVDDMPRLHPTGTRFRLAVHSATLRGQPVQLPPLLDVGWYAPRYGATNWTAAGAGAEAGAGAGAGASPGSDADASTWSLQRAPVALLPGERWAMTLRLKAPHGQHNPHGFDYELYLWEQGVQATGYVRTSAKDPVPQRLDAAPWRAPVAWLRTVLRERISQQVDDPHSAGLMAALVLGDQAAIDAPDWDVYRSAGLSHLISISGLHITLFAWLAVRLLGWLWRQSAWLCARWPAPQAAALGGLLLAAAYAALAGWGVPAQRTLCMLAVAVLVRQAGVRWPWQVVWLSSAVAVTLLDPWALLQPGFWLSFVAVAVLFATDLGAASAYAASSAGIFGWRILWRHVRALLYQQGVITLALAPLSIGLFGQLSLVGLVANLLAIPWVTLVLTPLSLLGVLVPPLWGLAQWAAQGFHAVASYLVAWPWASVHWPVPPWPLVVLGLVGALWLAWPMPWRMRLLGLPALLALLLWQPARPEPGQFALLAPDIGQGNAVLVQTAHHSLLYDAGPRYSEDSDAGNRVINPLLQALGVRLDVLLLSHRDTDHVGGAATVLQSQPQARLLSSLAPDHPLVQATGRDGHPAAQPCLAGQQWEWDGVRFSVLHPTEQDYAQSNSATKQRPNTLSCVLRIEAGPATRNEGGAVALLVGDIEAAQEQALLQRYPPDHLRADVLLVPHHGSKTSSTPDWLQAVQPVWAWVQAGYRNRYGHPAAPVVQRYAELGSALLVSPTCGAMQWQSNALSLAQSTVCSREGARRYWLHHVH